MQALTQGGPARDQFNEVLADQVTAIPSHQWAHALTLPTPDEAWALLSHALTTATEQVFEKQEVPSPHDSTEVNRTRKDLLRERRQLRTQLASYVGITEDNPLHRRLALLEKQLRDLTVKVKDFVRRKAQEHRDRLCLGVHEAWRERDFSMLHRLRTPVSRTGWGPRRRYYPTPPSKKIGAAEWHALLPLPGRDGGMNATACSTSAWEAECRRHMEALQDTPLVADANMHEQAKRDVVNTVKGLLSCPKRRAAPAWSHIPEVFLMALRPTMLTRRHHRPPAEGHAVFAPLQGGLHDEYSRYLGKHHHIHPCLPSRTAMAHAGHQGLGYVNTTPPTAQAFCDKFTELMLRCRCVATLPSSWHRCQSVPIDKPGSTAAGARSSRLIHVFGGITGGFFRGLQRDHPVPAQPSWAFGSLSGLSREGAILNQLATAWRAREHHCDLATTLFDATNAFASTTV
jgi:hypothetical protein